MSAILKQIVVISFIYLVKLLCKHLLSGLTCLSAVHQCLVDVRNRISQFNIVTKSLEVTLHASTFFKTACLICHM